MDKFGIFDLLDTLAQIASDAQPQEKPSDDTPATRVSPDDKAFLPPDFAPQNPAENEKDTRKNALASLYERHESISRRIDQKK